MKFLSLFDLHYMREVPESERLLDLALSIEGDFEGIVLGGDNAEVEEGMRSHHILFDRLVGRYGCPIGFIGGNHDLRGNGISSVSMLREVLPKFAREKGAVYLEEENMRIGDATFVGTYGHYDYSFWRAGTDVSMDDVLRGVKVIEGKRLDWKSRRELDWEGQSDPEVSQMLVRGFRERLKIARGRVYSLSHTLPSPALNGWPDCTRQYFLEAFSGTRSIGQALVECGGRYHLCGHTHKAARARLGSTDVVNVGSDLEALRYAIIETSNSGDKLVLGELRI